MWLTLLVPLLTKLFGSDGVIGTYIATKQQIQQKEMDAKLALATANVDLIKQQGIDAVQSEKNKLAATSQNFKYVTFVLINIPVIIMCISTRRGVEIFNALQLIPVWYATLYAAIYGVIWGLPVAANTMSTIFTAINSAWLNRQDKKIERIQVLGEATQIGKEAAKKEIFDTVKKVTGLKGFSQAQVDVISPILDKLLPNVAPTASSVTVNTGDK